MQRRSFLGALAASPLAAQSRRPNVLMIAIDDLRPELGCYGAKHIHSPNIDALAARGTVFERAYCQQSVCSPSRTSLLTGLRPDTTKIYELQTHFRKTIPSAVTLPENFKNQGYTTTGLGKIFHGSLEDEASWSIPHYAPGGPEWNTPENAERFAKYFQGIKDRGWKAAPSPSGTAARGTRGPSWLASDKPDEELADGRTATNTMRALNELKDGPFFIACGFLKPHLPFVAPKKYFDLYPDSKLKMPDYAPEPRGVPKVAMHVNGELRAYNDIPESVPIDEKKSRELVRAYYAATSYTDAQIGRVLGELDRLGLRDNTIVVLWGDHGWHLNNHGLWHKHTNFENATHSTLIAAAPGMKRGARTQALVEFVDIYPTISELANLRMPSDLEGRSFASLLADPKRTWKKAAFSQYPRGAGVMGYSVRTKRYRFTEWKGAEGSPIELYDYEKDPLETQNHAVLPGFDSVIAEHRAILDKGWKGALPV
ncbi:MAG: sulfatase [Bryobacteraceae bacterium]|nr:sulfatase [Bryobacteraceae bacterium]